MKHLLAFALIFASALFIALGGINAYDLQSIGATFVRLNAWVLVVTLYPRLMAKLGDDDLEQDWQRINDGNLAVAAYRSVEFAIVGIAAAMLIYKI
jgi:hypothetical protein